MFTGNYFEWIKISSEIRMHSIQNEKKYLRSQRDAETQNKPTRSTKQNAIAIIVSLIFSTSLFLSIFSNKFDIFKMPSIRWRGKRSVLLREPSDTLATWWQTGLCVNAMVITIESIVVRIENHEIEIKN